MCSKRLIYCNVPTRSKLLFAVSFTSLFCHISFPASIRLTIRSLKIVLLIPLNSYTGNRNCRLLLLILLRLNLEVHIFHCSREGSLAALVGVCIV